MIGMEIEYQKLGLVLIFVGILVISSSEIPFSYGEVSFIDVWTDKTSYKDGETIVISGTINKLTENVISLSIENPSGNIAGIAQIQLKSDKTFETEFVAGGGSWQQD